MTAIDITLFQLTAAPTPGDAAPRQTAAAPPGGLLDRLPPALRGSVTAASATLLPAPQRFWGSVDGDGAATTAARFSEQLDAFRRRAATAAERAPAAPRGRHDDTPVDAPATRHHRALPIDGNPYYGAEYRADLADGKFLFALGQYEHACDGLFVYAVGLAARHAVFAPFADAATRLETALDILRDNPRDAAALAAYRDALDGLRDALAQLRAGTAGLPADVTPVGDAFDAFYTAARALDVESFIHADGTALRNALDAFGPFLYLTKTLSRDLSRRSFG